MDFRQASRGQNFRNSGRENPSVTKLHQNMLDMQNPLFE